MHNKDDAAPKDAEDEHPDWRNDLAGSVVSLIIATVLSMHKSTCPSGTRLENALDALLQVYARDASGFLASVLNFQSASEYTDESTSEEHSGSAGIESLLETQQTDTDSFSLSKMLTEQQTKLHNLFLKNEAQKQEQDGTSYDIGLIRERLDRQQMNAEDETPSNQRTYQTQSCFYKEVDGIPSYSGRNSINEQMNFTRSYFNKEFIGSDVNFDKEPVNPPIEEQGADAKSSNHQAELSVSHFDTERIEQPKVDVVELKTEMDLVNTNLNKEWITERVDIAHELINQHITLNDSNLVMEMNNIIAVCPNKGSLNLPIEDDPTNQQTISSGSDFDMESFNQQTEMDVADLETETIIQEIDMAGFQLDQSTNQQTRTDAELANQKLVNDSGSDPTSLNQQTEMDVADLDTEMINQEIGIAGCELGQSTNQQAGTDANQQSANGSGSDRKSVNQQTEVGVVDFRTKTSSQQTDLDFDKLPVNQKLHVFTESISQHTSVTGLDFIKLSVKQQTDTMALHFNIQPVDQQSNSDTESITQHTVINSLDFNQQTEMEVVNFNTKSINQQTNTSVESVSQQTSLVNFDKKLVDQKTEINIMDLGAKSIQQQSKIIFKKRSVSQQTDINTDSLNQQSIAVGWDVGKKSGDQQTEINLHIMNQQTELMHAYIDKKSVSQQVELDVGKASTNQETNTSPYFYKESIKQQTDKNVDSVIQQTDFIGPYVDKESLTDETEANKYMNQQTDITGSSFNRQSIDQQTDNNVESINQQTDLADFYVDKKLINREVDVYLVKKSISQQTDLNSSHFKKETTNDHGEIDAILESGSINQQTSMTGSYLVKESINQQTDNNAKSANQQTDIPSSYFSKEWTDNQTEVDVNLGKKFVKQQVDMISLRCNKKSTNQQTDNNAESVNQQTDIPSSYCTKEWTDNQTEMNVDFGKKSVQQQVDTSMISSCFRTDTTKFPGVSFVNQQTDLSGSFLSDASHQDTDTSSFVTQTDLDSTDTETFNQQIDSTETAVQCSLLCGPNTAQLDVSNHHISFTNKNIPPNRDISTTETNVDVPRRAPRISQATQVYIWLRERGINTKGANTRKKLDAFGKSPQLSDVSEYSDSISDLELDSIMETVRNVNTQITSACENLSALKCNCLSPMLSHCSVSDDTEEHSETESVDREGGKLPESDQQRLLAFFHATLLKAIENQPDLAYFVPSSASYARIQQNQCDESELINNAESEESASESGSVIFKPADEPSLINSDNTSIVVKREDLIPFEERNSNLNVIDEQRTLPNSGNSQETVIEQPSSTICGSSIVLGNIVENESVLISSNSSPKRNQPEEIKSSDENKKLTKSSSNLAVINLRSESLLRCSTSRKLKENVSKLVNEEVNGKTNQEELVPWSVCNTEAMPSPPAFSSALIDEAIARSREVLSASNSRSNQTKDQLQTNCRNKKHEFAFSPSSSEVDTSKDIYGLSSFGRRDIGRPTTPIRKSRSIGGHELSRMEDPKYIKAQATTSTCISSPSRRRDVADDFLNVRRRGNEFYTASENISTSSGSDFRNNRRSRLAPSICNSQGDKDNNLLEQSTPSCGKEEEQTFPNQVLERPVPLGNSANASGTPQHPTNNCLRTTEESSEEPSKCTSEELRSSVSISRGCLKRYDMSRKSSDSTAQLKESRRRSSISLQEKCKIYEEDLLQQSYIHSKHCDESRDSSKRSRKKRKVDSSKNSELQNNNSVQQIKQLVEAKTSIIRCNEPTIKDIIPVEKNRELSKTQSKCGSTESKHRSRRDKSNDLSEPIISVKLVAKEATEAKKTWSSCNNILSNDRKLLNKIERANREWRAQTVFPMQISKSSKRVELHEADDRKSDNPPKKVNKRSPSQHKTREQQDIVQNRDSSSTRIKNQPEPIIIFHERGKTKHKSKRRNSSSKNREKRNDSLSSSTRYYSDLRNGSPLKLTHSRSSLSPSTVQSGSTTTDIVRGNMSSESIQSDGIKWDDYARAHNIVTLKPKLSRFYLGRDGRLQQSPQADNHSRQEFSISSNSIGSTNSITYRRECSPITTARDTDLKHYTYTLVDAGPSRHMKKHQRSDSASRSPSSFHRKYSGLSIASSATTVGQSEGLFESMSSEKSDREFSDKTSVLMSTQRRSTPSENKSQFQDSKSNTLPLQSAFAKKNGDRKDKKKKKVTFQSGDTSPPRTTQVRVWTQQLTKTEEAIKGLRARIQGLSTIMHF